MPSHHVIEPLEWRACDALDGLFPFPTPLGSIEAIDSAMLGLFNNTLEMISRVSVM